MLLKQRKKITDQIRELEKDEFELETPISVSLDLQSLRQSEKPEDRSLADLVGILSGVRGEIGKIATKVDSIDSEEKIEVIEKNISQISRHLFEISGERRTISSKYGGQFNPRTSS